MRTQFYFLILSLIFVSCKKDFYSGEENATAQPAVKSSSTPVVTATDNAHNSMNSINYLGTYNGVLPCADCDGIKTKITLSNDGGFKRSLQYLGKENEATVDTGVYTWNASGSKITLSNDDDFTQSYQVGENVLYHLDNAGNKITGDLASYYELKKEAHVYQEIENKRWILVELIGKPVELPLDQRPYLFFNAELSRVTGNNGCNTLNGNYELTENGQLKIGEISLTQKSCPNISQAASFNQVIHTIDNYTLKGGVLSLNKSKMATLAKFELL